MISKMRDYIKKLELSINDAILIVGISFGIVLFFESSNLMLTHSPQNTYLPFWLIILSFAIFFASSVIYVFLSIKKKQFKYSLVGCIIFGVLLLANIVILAGPTSFTIIYPFYNKVLTTNISLEVKAVYFFWAYIILASIFVGIYCFPYRIKNQKFIFIVLYLMLIAAVIAIIYSLIVETSNYSIYFKELFNMGKFEPYAPKSFFPHRNVYGFFLEFCICVTLICHALSKQKRYIYISLGLYLNLLLTMCKTGILLSSIALITYYFCYLFISFKSDKDMYKKPFVIYVIAASLVIVSLIVIIFAIEPIRVKFLAIFRNGETLDDRMKIIRNSWAIITSSSPLYGSGFGVYQSLLYDANELLTLEYTYSSHNWFFSIFGSGGALYLTGYLSLLIYAGFLNYKLFKVNKQIAVSFLIAFIVLFAHSFFEDNFYLIIFALILQLIVLVDNKKRLAN